MALSNKWLFCFVCLSRFESLGGLVEHIIDAEHAMSKQERKDFREVQDAVGLELDLRGAR